MKLLTFDIEDWFHLLDTDAVNSIEFWSHYESRVEENTEYILNALKTKNLRGIFFILGWIAEHYPRLVERIHNDGHIIGTHSYAHGLVYEQSLEEFKSDLKRSMDIISQITQQPTIHYRAPGFSVTKETPWVFDTLAECGIQYDFSVFNAKRAHGGFTNGDFRTPFIINTAYGDIIEFPLSYIKILKQKFVYSGGGYFRILPLSFINQFCRFAQYANFYFHPRDFDPSQPILQGLGLRRHFKSYVGLRSAKSKFENLLSAHDFTDPESIYNIDRSRMKKFDYMELLNAG